MIYLASQSPRRVELLQQIGVSFHQLMCEIDESPHIGELPAPYVQRMAEHKAVEGWRVRKLHNLPEKPLLASDTSVVCQNTILGKPENDHAARDMLKQLSGRTHQVITAIAVTDGLNLKIQSVTTDVTFHSLTGQQISDYIMTGEPEGKAGAYAIQGKGAVLVSGIRGSYSSVVGLPLSETAQILNQFNIPVWQ
ncbi:septum formation protein Maf [Endozoicomonas sp. (ex Bugula neritina AB1)]|nr:septum formation protein Maf [Endozoicomonas sp. (ex Bugula neritina AB1)]